MTALYKQIQDDLRTVIKDSISKSFPTSKVIFGFENGTEPTGTYCVISVLDYIKTGLAETSTRANPVDDHYEVWTNIPYEILVQIDFVGKDAGAMSLECHTRLSSSYSNKELSMSLNVGLLNMSSIRRRPQKRDTTYVDIRTFDARFNAVLSYTEEIGIITRVDIQEPFNNTIINVPPL